MTLASSFTHVFESVEFGIAVLGVVIIVYGVAKNFIRLVQLEILSYRNISIESGRNMAHKELGEYLLLGLSFLVAADIARTILGPTLTELAILGCIVVIRTVLHFFLEKEIEHLRTPQK